MGVRLPLEQVDRHLGVLHRGPRKVERNDVELERLLRGGPGVGLDAQEDAGRPERDACRDGLDLPVGIGVLELRDQVARRQGTRDPRHLRPERPVRVENEVSRPDRGFPRRGPFRRTFFLPVPRFRLAALAPGDPLYYRSVGEHEVSVPGEAHGPRRDVRPEADGGPSRPSSREVGDEQVEIGFPRVDPRAPPPGSRSPSSAAPGIPPRGTIPRTGLRAPSAHTPRPLPRSPPRRPASLSRPEPSPAGKPRIPRASPPSGSTTPTPRNRRAPMRAASRTAGRSPRAAIGPPPEAPRLC